MPDPSVNFTPERRAALRSQGAEIARARKAAGLTQAQAAERLGASLPTVKSWERGLRGAPAADRERIAARWGADRAVLGLGLGEVCPTCGQRFPHATVPRPSVRKAPKTRKARSKENRR